jgi:hypothetical protein
MRESRVWLPLLGSGTMAILYNIDPERRLVETRVSGETSLEEVEEYLHRLTSDPAYHPDYVTLVDVRETPTLFTASELRALSDFVRSHSALTRARQAVVAGTDAAFGLMRMYEVFTADLPRPFRVFRNLNDACEWLSLAPHTGNTH